MHNYLLTRSRVQIYWTDTSISIERIMKLTKIQVRFLQTRGLGGGVAGDATVESQLSAAAAAAGAGFMLSDGVNVPAMPCEDF